jgi:hypothetical protein
MFSVFNIERLKLNLLLVSKVSIRLFPLKEILTVVLTGLMICPLSVVSTCCLVQAIVKKMRPKRVKCRNDFMNSIRFKKIKLML